MLVNDLLSVAKDAADEKPVCNIVSLIADDRGCSLTEATEITVALHNDFVRGFEATHRDLAAVPSVVAVLSYNFGVRTLGVVTGTAFLNFIPVSALLMGTALGAPPALHELVGAAMVVSALFIHTGAQKRAVPAQQRRPVAV